MSGPANTSDPHGWLAELANRLGPELRAYLRRFSQNPSDVEDWAQEALMRVCAAAMNRELLEPRAYLFRTARNVALSRLEHRKIRQAVRFEVEMIGRQRQERPPVHRIAQSGQEVANLLELIEGLPSRCREAFVLCKVYGFSHGEIADIMQISTSTVEKHLVKGLRLCRDLLAGQQLQGEDGRSDEGDGDDVGKSARDSVVGKAS